MKSCFEVVQERNLLIRTCCHNRKYEVPQGSSSVLCIRLYFPIVRQTDVIVTFPTLRSIFTATFPPVRQQGETK